MLWLRESSWIWASHLDEVGSFECCVCMYLCWEVWQLHEGVRHSQGHSGAGFYLTVSLWYVLHLHSSFEKEVWDKQEVSFWQFLEIQLLFWSQCDCPIDTDPPTALCFVQTLILLWKLPSSFCLLGLTFWSLGTGGTMVDLKQRVKCPNLTFTLSI